MDGREDERKRQLEQLERLLTPVQGPQPPPMPHSAPAHPLSAPPHPHLQLSAMPHTFVSPASVAEPYGFTSRVHKEEPQQLGLPELTLPALALPDALAHNAAGVAARSGGGSAGPTVADAMHFVMEKERGSLELLLLHVDAKGTPSARLRAALRVPGAVEARVRVEKALGRWVVHECRPRTEEYDPARAEHAVLASAREGGGLACVYHEFDRSIRAHAEAQKDRLKLELDARRAALHGVLNDRHAKAVNNQKSAHLSKFLAAQVAAATDRLVRWLVTQRYAA